MKNVNKTTTHINCYIFRSVYGKKGVQLQRRIEYFLRNNGVEWFVNRQKAIYQAALLLKSGQVEKAISIYQDNSISYTKKGYPSDEWFDVVKTFVETTKPTTMKKMVGLMRCYTGYKLSELSRKQYQKLKSSINQPLDNRFLESVWEYSDLVGQKAKEMDRISAGYPKGYRIRQRIKEQDLHISRLSPFTATHVQDFKYTKGMHDLPYFKVVASLVTSSYLPKSLHSIIPSNEMREAVELLNEEKGITEYAGRIHTIQEKGAKARTVGIPNSWIQTAFVTVHRKMQKFSETVLAPWSCMMNQDKGVLLVREHMNNGNNVVSVDLSSATDRFPLELQTSVLRNLDLTPWADALEEIALARWTYPQGKNYENEPYGTDFSYATGQPMGLYGSFPLFHSTHILFVKCIEDKMYQIDPSYEPKRFSNNTCFQVLGDDIVFADERLATMYISALDQIGVEHSPSKTFWRGISEFAGYITVPAKTRGREYFVSFRPYKYPDEDFVTNPVSFMDSFRIPIGKSQRWKRIFQAYQDTANLRNLDLSPIFSEDNSKENSASRDMVIGTLASYAKSIGRLHESTGRFDLNNGHNILAKLVPCERLLAPDTPTRYGEGFPVISQKDFRISHSPLVQQYRRANQDPLIKSSLSRQQSDYELEQKISKLRNEVRERNSRELHLQSNLESEKITKMKKNYFPS